MPRTSGISISISGGFPHFQAVLYPKNKKFSDSIQTLHATINGEMHAARVNAINSFDAIHVAQCSTIIFLARLVMRVMKENLRTSCTGSPKAGEVFWR